MKVVAIFLAVLCIVGFSLPALVSAEDTSCFDGGPGSTSNTTYDSSSDVPDVGPSGPVGYYDKDMNYHSN